MLKLSNFVEWISHSNICKKSASHMIIINILYHHSIQLYSSKVYWQFGPKNVLCHVWKMIPQTKINPQLQIFFFFYKIFLPNRSMFFTLFFSHPFFLCFPSAFGTLDIFCFTKYISKQMINTRKHKQ